MNEQEEAMLIQSLWSKGSVTIFDRILFRNFFHVSGRTPEDLPGYLRKEPSAHLAVVSCCDCQVDTNNIFQLRPGEAIMLQNGGNVSNPDLIRSLIVAVYELSVTHIVVLGHVNCTFKGLNVEHLEIKTSKAAKITAESFGFTDPKVFYRPIDDVLDNTIQQARILSTHPLFRQRVEISPMLYDEASGFVYNADILQANRTTQALRTISQETSAPVTGDSELVIKSDTPRQVAIEIEKLLKKFPGNTPFVMKVLRNWQWEKYVEMRAKSAPRKVKTQTVATSIPDLIKSAAVEKLATLNKLIALVPASAVPAPASMIASKEGMRTGIIEDTPWKRDVIEKASEKTTATTKVIAATIHAAQKAIPTNLVAPVPRVVIPKIYIPRARIPRLRFVVEYAEEENSPE